MEASANDDRLVRCLNIGLVLERRNSDHPWQDHAWHVIDVVAAGGPVNGWRKVREGDGWVQYYAGSFKIELFRDETEGYKLNLSNDPPMVYVVLREAADATEAMVPFRVTVCPYEAQDYLDSGEDKVEGVPMPPEIAAWVRGFVDRYHVDQPFVKRQRGAKVPRADRQPRGGQDDVG